MKNELSQIISQSRSLVFFGGAGVSTESGIPDFRSVDGLYNQKYDYPPEQMLSHTFFERKTEEFYRFYRDKILSYAVSAKPNAAHKKLAELEKKGILSAVVTQNIDGLHQAALCRAKADWLVGINATRLFSVLYHRTLNIGRVMSPTLALIVQREAEIDTFKPVPFYTIVLELPEFSVSGERMADKAAAEQLKTACQGADVTVKKV